MCLHLSFWIKIIFRNYVLCRIAAIVTSTSWVTENSIPTRRNNIFNIIISVHSSHSTHNASRIPWKVENESILMRTECVNSRFPGPSAYPTMCGIQHDSRRFTYNSLFHNCTVPSSTVLFIIKHVDIGIFFICFSSIFFNNERNEGLHHCHIIV